MKSIFYQILIILSNLLGDWFFSLVSKGIASGYFMFFPKRVAVGVRFYRALFPGKNRWFYLWCTWRQYQNFTSVYLDRYLARRPGDIRYQAEGAEHIDNALETRKGGVILMSHLGNWDAAAHLLARQWSDIRLMIYMGRRDREDIEQIQKESLTESGIQVVAVDMDAASPFDIVEGVRFIRQGGLVILAADILWHKEQRFAAAEFLGHEIRLPVAPHVMAMLTGAPLYVFFNFRLRNRHYRFELSAPFHLETASRQERDAVIRKSVQRYAALLEQALRRHPFEWYHFEPFLEKRLEESDRTREPPCA